MGVEGVSGVVFGGPERDILFIVVSSSILNTKTRQPMEIITTGSSLYKVTGLGVTGPKPARFKVPEPCRKQGC